MESAYEDMDQTPRASPRPAISMHPAALRQCRASFDTASSFNAGSSATSVSVVAAQQNELVATVNRLTKSVASLSNNSIYPAQIMELTDRLNMLSVNSLIHTNQRPSPGFRHQTPVVQARDLPYPQHQPSRLYGTGRVGSFLAPSAYHHQQTPRRSNIPPPPPLCLLFLLLRLVRTHLNRRPSLMLRTRHLVLLQVR